MRIVARFALCFLALSAGACGGNGGGSGLDSGSDGDADSDTDGDTDDECDCSEQEPQAFGDCAAGEDLDMAALEIAAIADLFCTYSGPSGASAAADVDFISLDHMKGVAVIQGEDGWEDFASQCLATNSELGEEDLPGVDFASQRAVFFMATYEWDCTYDGTGVRETRAGDPGDGSAQVNGYFYNTGTQADCTLEGFGWEDSWLVVLDTEAEIRACLRIAISPPA